jgi:cytochrome c oxidase assembly factor CtaG
MHHHGDVLQPFTFAGSLAWAPDRVFLAGCLLALGLYGAGVWRLHRRGDHWPIGRTLAWGGGILSILLVTCTRINDYGMQMFSVHMVQHMVLPGFVVARRAGDAGVAGIAASGARA